MRPRLFSQLSSASGVRGSGDASAVTMLVSRSAMVPSFGRLLRILVMRSTVPVYDSTSSAGGHTRMFAPTSRTDIFISLEKSDSCATFWSHCFSAWTFDSERGFPSGFCGRFPSWLR
eukprot:scaffold38389_cov70-Phaeocystis_antarctica.AAC.1